VDLTKDEGFGFLGFDFRRVQSLNGAWRAQFTPKLKKRTALLRKLADVFKHSHSQPVTRVVARINPILRGWVNYFAIGHSARCFSYVRDWVEMKMRRHLLRSQQRRGLWGLPRAVLHRADRRVSPIGLITLGAKLTGKLLAGNPHEQFDVAGGLETDSPERRACPRPYPQAPHPSSLSMHEDKTTKNDQLSETVH
jgi:hypothetical protein